MESRQKQTWLQEQDLGISDQRPDTGEKWKLKPANGESYTASDFKNYDFSKEQVAVTYENGTAVPVPN